MNPRDLRKMDVEFKQIKIDVPKFRRRPPAYMPGEYLVRLDLESIQISEDTKMTPPNLPFGVNQRFQRELSVLKGKHGLKYFAPLFANGFLHRSDPPMFLKPKPNVDSWEGIWNDSKITPQLQALQTLPVGQQPSVDQAKADLQYMLLKFPDEAEGERAAEYLEELKAQCGITSLNKVPLRYIPVLRPKPEPANKPPQGGKKPDPITQAVEAAWWRDAIGLTEKVFDQINVTEWSPFKTACIAVLDTGCALEHPHLQPGIGVIKAATDDVEDCTGHGTHVCGILVAKEPAMESGISLPQGIGPQRFKLDIYKVVKDMQVDDSWDTEYMAIVDADLYLSALKSVLDNPLIQTVSISLCGTKPYSNESDDVEHTMFKKLLTRKRNGVNAVAAAGNGNDALGTDVRYPACFPEVISVGATEFVWNKAPSIWKWSNQGIANLEVAGRTRRAVDIYAPGSQIRSTYVNWYINDSKQEVGHLAGAQLSGTSMATPMVAAVVALLRSRKIKPMSAAGVMSWIKRLKKDSQLRLDKLLLS
jgi:hypothetical protein